MNTDLRKLPEMKVAYIRNAGPYGPAIGEAFHKVFEWAIPAGVIKPPRLSLAVYWDDPQQTPPEECRADACITIPDNVVPDPSSDIKVQTLPGGDYAMFLKYAYTCEDFKTHWTDVMTKEFPKTGKECDCRPCYEIYYNSDQCNQLKKCVFDICIPVK